ncbi:MAG: hypothetical protein HYS33_03435 [Acidobacteria bacterium]|nr:hypothetical protein [Acidobacteriota bacterium]
MHTVVIGGHSRNIGKTSVMAGLIRALRSFQWTAVKITQYGHGICSLDGRPCGCEPEEHPFVLIEEKNPRGRGDTCRFLKAGAKRSLWLRVRQGQLAEALPLFRRALEGAEFVMIESNSILEYLEPALYLVVLDSSQRDFKSSARRFIGRSDAFVPVESRLDPRAWPGLDSLDLDDKPVFPVSRPHYSNPELCRFVLEKLPPAKSAARAASGG